MHKLLSRLLAVPAVLTAAPALAHPSHVESLAGHSHWLALGAVGGVCLIGAVRVAGFLARRRAAAPQRAE